MSSALDISPEEIAELEEYLQKLGVEFQGISDMIRKNFEQILPNVEGHSIRWVIDTFDRVLVQPHLIGVKKDLEGLRKDIQVTLLKNKDLLVSQSVQMSRHRRDGEKETV